MQIAEPGLAESGGGSEDQIVTRNRLIRNGLFAAAALVILCGCDRGTAPAPVEPPVAPPNIVFILADDHATQAVSAYGSHLISTPGIDRLAEEGVIFDRALAPNSICAPARATLLTGKYSHLNGQLNNVLPFDGDQPQVQKMLQEAGYTTAMIGKWHLQSEPRGFDHWEVLSDDWEQGYYYDPALKSPAGEVRREGYATDIVTDRAIEWIDANHAADGPFMALVWHKAPHRPWDPAAEDLALFEDVEYPIPETFRDSYAGRASPVAQQTMRIDRHLVGRDLKLKADDSVPERIQPLWESLPAPPQGADRDVQGEWKLQRYLRHYLAVVQRLDQNVGRLVDYLDAAGILDNTLVVYASDQGFFLGEHGWFDKRWFHEESVRLPLVVRLPGAENAGLRVAEIVSQTDVAPTLLEVAGAASPADMQGASLLPLLRGEVVADWRTSFYYHYWEYPGPHSVARHLGVITDRYKLVHYYRSDEWELFDRQADPLEMTNAYEHPDYSGTVRELKAELRRLQRELGDMGPHT